MHATADADITHTLAAYKKKPKKEIQKSPFRFEEILRNSWRAVLGGARGGVTIASFVLVGVPWRWIQTPPVRARAAEEARAMEN